MIEPQLEKKLKKALNPKRFRFVVILYHDSRDRNRIKEFIALCYPENKKHTLDIETKSYEVLAPYLYVDESFNFVDDALVLFKNKALYTALNQRRDKIASFATNLIFFAPKKLENQLYRDATTYIPDFWEYRSAILSIEQKEGEEKSIKLEELDLAYQYSGLTQKEKQKEIKRIAKRVEEENLSDEESAILLDNEAYLYTELGEYEKALPLVEKALKINEEILGEKHPDTATSYNNLAALYESMGEYEKALPLYEKALKINEEVLGEKHPDTAASYNNLAALYESMGEYEKALPLYEKALKISEELLEKNHPFTATSYNNLAGLYQSMGEYEKALPQYEKALKIREEVLGEKHPSSATSYNNLAGLYQSMGEYEKALPQYEKALKIFEEVLGENHPSTATSYNNVASLYESLGENEKAHRYLKKAIKIYQKTLPQNHPNLIDSLKGLNMIERKLHPKKTTQKVGRNAPCPCGSGKKYKKCCANAN